MLMQGRRRVLGLSLVELMVSMAIALVIVGVVLILLSRVSTTASRADDSSLAIENGNFSLRLIGEDLRLAGFMGVFNDPARVELQVSSLMANSNASNCGGAGWAFQFLNAANQPNFIEYYAPLSSNLTSLPCVPSANVFSTTPALVVRHAGSIAQTDPNNDGNLSDAFASDDNRLYLQSSVRGGIIFRGKDYSSSVRGTGRYLTVLNAAGTTIDGPVFPYVVNIYYIRPCSRPAGSTCAATDDNGQPIPTLVRRQISDSAAPSVFVETPVADGVERMAITFGVDNNGDGVPDRYTSAPTSFDNVMTARISLLLRTANPVTSHDDRSFTYTLADGSTFNCATASADCRYRRFLFNDTVQLRNYVFRRL